MFEPIGHYRGDADAPALAPRQGAFTPLRPGRIELIPSLDPLVLRDLEGIGKIWILFHFHRARGWKPLVLPPHTSKRRGVFATRSPYRPNAIGMTAVDLESVAGRTVFVRGADLLDGTPVLDLKPYLPYADAFPGAAMGWVDEERRENPVHEVILGPGVGERVAWLEQQLKRPIGDLLQDQLSVAPTLAMAKRIRALDDGWCFSFRTWRFHFRIEGLTVRVERVASAWQEGSTEDSGQGEEGGAEVHRAYLERFGP